MGSIGGDKTPMRRGRSRFGARSPPMRSTLSPPDPTVTANRRACDPSLPADRRRQSEQALVHSSSVELRLPEVLRLGGFDSATLRLRRGGPAAQQASQARVCVVASVRVRVHDPSCLRSACSLVWRRETVDVASHLAGFQHVSCAENREGESILTRTTGCPPTKWVS